MSSNYDRLTTLSPVDIKMLELAYNNLFPFKNNDFWVQVEDALINPDTKAQLYKCTCGLIIRVPKEYIEKAKIEYDKSDKTKCWHSLASENQILNFDLSVDAKLQEIELLRVKEDPKLVLIAHSLVPLLDSKVFSYSLSRLKWAMEYNHYAKKSLANKQKSHQIKAIRVISQLIKQAKKVNESEFNNFFAHYSSKKEVNNLSASIGIALAKSADAFEVINNAAYLRLSKQFSTSRRVNKSDLQQAKIDSIRHMLSSYQSYFETKEIINIIYNLVRIINGETFSPTPFSGKVIRVHSKIQPIGNKKALMLRLIIQESNIKNLNILISEAYDNKLRNDTEGHNDYVIEKKNNQVRNKTNNNAYTFTYIEEKLRRINSLVNAITSALAFNSFNNDADIKMISETGIIAIIFGFDKEKPADGLSFCQFWSNADLDRKCKNVTRLNLEYDEKKKFIWVSFSDTIYKPGSLMSIPTSKHTLDWLKNAATKEEIKVNRIAIAPKIEYFMTAAQNEMTIENDDFFVVGKFGKKIKVDKENIMKIIEKLETLDLKETTHHVHRTYEEMYKKVKDYQ